MFNPSLLTRVEAFHSNKQAALSKKEQELSEKRAALYDVQSLFKNTEQAYLETFDSKFEKKMDSLREQVQVAKKAVEVVEEQLTVMEKNQFKLTVEDIDNLRNEYLKYIEDTEPMLKELTKIKDEFKVALVKMTHKHRENFGASSYALSYISQLCSFSVGSKEFSQLRSVLYPFAHSSHAEFHNFIGEVQAAYSEAKMLIGESAHF